MKGERERVELSMPDISSLADRSKSAIFDVKVGIRRRKMLLSLKR